MGMFSFIADIGNKLFGDDEEDHGASKIKNHIEQDNPGVDGLQIEVNDGVASLKGKAKDSSAAEKAILMAGNVLGIGEVNADELEHSPPEDDVTFYEIQKGDTLWGIASKQYGDGS